MFNLLKKWKNYLIQLIMIVILISSVAYFYRPHLKKEMGIGDDVEWYSETKERDTLSKVFDYNYPTKRFGQTAYYNPVQMLVWRYMIKNYDRTPYPYYLLCMIIHILNVIIVFFLSKEILKKPFPSFAVALSFALLYLNYKTVSWIAACITTGISSTFIFLTILLFIRYFNHKNILYYILSCISFAIGLLTKEFVMFYLTVLFIYYILTRNSHKSSTATHENYELFQMKFKLRFRLLKTDLLFIPYILISLPMIYIILQRINNSAIVQDWGGFNFGIHMYYRFFEILNYLIIEMDNSNLVILITTGTAILIFPLLIYYGIKDRILLFLLLWLIISIGIYSYSNFRCISGLYRYLYLPSAAWFCLLYYFITKLKRTVFKIIFAIPLIGYTIGYNIALILIKK